MDYWDKIWSEAEKVAASVKLEIAEPPCKTCRHWTPRIKTDETGKFAGIVCCSAKKMHRDFSCFEDSEPKAPPVFT
jgi:hypothetical protein